MRAIATLAAALLVGACTADAQERSAEGDNAPAPPPSKGNWFTRWLPFGHKAEAKKPAPEADSPPPTVVESAASIRKREEAALLRRKAVCMELQAVALRTNDEALMRKAEELNQLAWETYVLRTAHLPASAAAFDSDEQTLDQRLGSRAGDGRSSPAAASRRAPGTDGVAARRE